MRLIDAEAFKAYMRGALEQTRRCYPDGGEWAEAVTEEFCRDIDEQPTAQPERLKGHWLVWGGMDIPENHGRHICSSCGEFAPVLYEKPLIKEYLSDFCPSCGADMRGEE